MLVWQVPAKGNVRSLANVPIVKLSANFASTYGCVLCYKMKFSDVYQTVHKPEVSTCLKQYIDFGSLVDAKSHQDMKEGTTHHNSP